MKTIIYSLIIAVSMFCSGCGDKKGDDKANNTNSTITVEKRAPTVEEYRSVLEKMKNSVDGAKVDIQMLCDEYRKATDDDKRKLYNAAKAHSH